MTMKTDRQTLLAAVRRGDFGALLSLADLWEEDPACGPQAAMWAKLVERVRWHVANRDRLRMGVLESMARWFRDWAYALNRREGKPWRLPYKPCVHSVAVSKDYQRAWDWCRDMADKLIRHVKATGESR
jgi:hypothetical protein